MSISPIGSNPTIPVSYNPPAGTVSQNAPVTSTGSGVAGTGGGHAPPPSSRNGAIQSVDLTGGSQGSSATTEDLSNAQELIDQLHATPPSDIMALAMAVVEEASAASREAQEQALNQSNMAVNQLMAQAGALRKEAGEMMAGAVASLVMTCVASAVSIAGALKSGAELSELATSSSVSKSEGEMPGQNPVGSEDIQTQVPKDDISPKPEVERNQTAEVEKKEDIVLKDSQQGGETITTKSGTDGKDVTPVDEDTKAMQKLEQATKNDGLFNLKLQQIQNSSSLTQAVSQIFGAVGNFAGTMAQAESKLTEADGAVDAAEAQQLQSFSQQSQSIAQSLSKTIDQMISAMQSIQQTQADMMRTMTKV